MVSAFYWAGVFPGGLAKDRQHNNHTARTTDLYVLWLNVLLANHVPAKVVAVKANCYAL